MKIVTFKPQVFRIVDQGNLLYRAAVRNDPVVSKFNRIRIMHVEHWEEEDNK